MKMTNILKYKGDGLLVTGASGHSARYFFEKLSAENYDKRMRLNLYYTEINND